MTEEYKMYAYFERFVYFEALHAKNEETGYAKMPLKSGILV